MAVSINICSGGSLEDAGEVYDFYWNFTLAIGKNTNKNKFREPPLLMFYVLVHLASLSASWPPPSCCGKLCIQTLAHPHS